MASRMLVLAALLAIVLAGCSSGPVATGTPDGPSIKEDAIATIRSVDDYQVRTNVTRRRAASGGGRPLARLEIASEFDRSAREFKMEQSGTRSGQSIERRIYLVDGTLYRWRPSYARFYNSSWIKEDVSGNLTRLWRQVDALKQQRRLLENASLERTGTATVDGNETVVLDAEMNVSTYTDIVAVGSSVTNVSLTYWVASGSAHLRKVRIVLDRTRTTPNGEVETTTRFVIRFAGYDEPADIELPEAARDAVATSR